MTCILSKAPLLYRAVCHKNVTLGSTTKLILVRTCKHLTNRTTVSAQERLKIKDNVNSDYRLIYREQRAIINTTFVAYHAGWILIALSLSATAYLLYNIFVLQTPEPDLKWMNIRSISRLTQFDIMCVAVVTGIALIMSSKMVPFRIYYNSKEKLYKVVFVKNIFRKTQLVTFAERSAVPVFKTRMGDALFYVNGDRIILLDEDSFPIPFQREKMIRRMNSDF